MDPLSFGYVAGGVSGLGGLASNLAFGIADRQNQKKQQARDNFWRSWYAGLDLQQFENTKEMQQWQKDAWSKEFEYNKELNDRNFDLATNAANYRAQDLVNAGMSPLLAAGGAAQTPQTVSAPAASSMPTGSGRGGSSPSAPSVGAYNADAFMKFADFMANLKLIEAQTRKLNAEAGATESVDDPTSARGAKYKADLELALQSKSESEARTKLANQKVDESIAYVSNLKADTFFKLAQYSKARKEAAYVGQQIKNLDLSYQMKRDLLDWSRQYGVPADSVNSDMVIGFSVAKILAKRANNENLTYFEQNFLNLFDSRSVSDKVTDEVWNGVVELFSLIMHPFNRK